MNTEQLAKFAETVAVTHVIEWTTMRIFSLDTVFPPVIEFHDVEKNLVAILWSEKGKWRTMKDKNICVNMHMAFNGFLRTHEIFPDIHSVEA